MLKFVTEPQFKKKNVALLGGIRKFESERRKLNYPYPICDDSNKIWFVNPILKLNSSQYSGTLKNSICTRCKKSLNNKTREQQDEHETQCLMQEKLF